MAPSMSVLRRSLRFLPRAQRTLQACGLPITRIYPTVQFHRPAFSTVVGASTSHRAMTTAAGADFAAEEQSKRARDAAAQMSVAPAYKRNAALAELEAQLLAREQEILKANQDDVAAEEAAGRPVARLSLQGKIGTLVEGLRDVRKMKDPLGQVSLARSLSDGLSLFRVSTPMGVLLIIFEARPDAAVQIFSLAVKTGNAVILKGGSEATRTLQILQECMEQAMSAADLPKDAVQLVVGREAASALLKPGLVDLIIPRGSNELVQNIMRSTTTPVMGHADGICHVFVDSAANLEMAKQIVKDSKTNYPQACNAAETLLVHKDVAQEFVPALADILPDSTFKACPQSLSLLGTRAVAATDSDYSTEWGDLTIGVKVVNDMAEGIQHIRKHGSAHTDVIVTSDTKAMETFTAQVDSAGVYVNASSRFADGFRYGFGAEVGVSTGKLHARGPVGLDGILSYKYKIFGDGHTVGGPNPTKLQHQAMNYVESVADIPHVLAGSGRDPRVDLVKAKRILVKVGSNVVTRSQGGGVALGRLANLVEQIAQLVRTGREVVLISSGGVAAGKRVLKDAWQDKVATDDASFTMPIPSSPLPVLAGQEAPGAVDSTATPERKRQFSAAGQSKLMALYEQLFGVYDMHIAQILISIPDLEYTRPRKMTCQTIEGLMREGIVPIVNENDAIAYEAADGDGSIDKEELPITDNDSIAAVIAVELGCDLAILLSEVDGVYEDMSNPVPIPVLNPDAEKAGINFSEKSSAGRGGMESKVNSAAYMMRRGVKSVIANGGTPSKTRTLLDIVRGNNVGTLIAKI